MYTGLHRQGKRKYYYDNIIQLYMLSGDCNGTNSTQCVVHTHTRTIVSSNLFHVLFLLIREPVHSYHTAFERNLLELHEVRPCGRYSGVVSLLPTLRDPLFSHYSCATCHCHLLRV